MIDFTYFRAREHEAVQALQGRIEDADDNEIRLITQFMSPLVRQLALFGQALPAGPNRARRRAVAAAKRRRA
ncbi:MAG: hypothetical protein K2X54_11435 [Methylobacterium organophilum]|nr:hypothetical protein [Methylobacterium organophilum]